MVTVAGGWVFNWSGYCDKKQSYKFKCFKSQKQNYFVAIQIAGRRVTCVAYDIEQLFNPIRTHDPDQNPPITVPAVPTQETIQEEGG